MSATWRARLDEHLGNYTVEAAAACARRISFAAAHAVYGVTHLAALMRLLPERDPHAALYDALETILDRLDDAGVAAPMVVRFELQLLAELGFGLDLAQCAATGASGRSHLCVAEIGAGGVAHGRRAMGRQDAAAAGVPARARAVPAGRDLADGFALTGFFLTRHVLEPRGLALADERAHFIAALARALPSVA